MTGSKAETGGADRHPTLFVARLEGRWYATPVPGEPEAIDLDGLLALLDRQSDEAIPDAPEGALPTPAVGDDDLVAPSWCWVGRACRRGLIVEDPTGRGSLIDRHDLAVLDAVDARRPSRDLGLDPGVGAAERLGRLATLGTITIAAGPPAVGPAADDPSDAAPPEPTIEPASTEPADPADADPGDPLPHRPTLGERIRTAYRLSSKLAPLRRALERPSHAAPLPADEPNADDHRDPVLHPLDEPRPGRIPVYAVWHPELGPPLSLGMLTAAARAHRGGALTDAYEIRRPESAESFLADVGRARGPGIVLLSNYVWSIDANLALARRALDANPDLVMIFGGPSAPKYAGDAERFLDEHRDRVHVLVRGEGEQTICELLEALRPPQDAPAVLHADAPALEAVAGITFRRADGSLVRTEDRERVADLDTLPSPYLTGEFDHIPAEAWNVCNAIETNRGCPFGCTYCDWGSSTMSRVRRFDLGRVQGEIAWMAQRGIESLFIADANFGMLKRDVDIAEFTVDQHTRTGFPKYLLYTPAKNNIRNLVAITATLVDGGVGVYAALGLQTVDPDTLEAIDRQNISTDAYLELAADYRRHGLPLINDELLGLPGQTYEKFLGDLQFHVDHEILIRMFTLQLLPNAPMNAPEYRAEHGIEVDDQNVVIATSSFGPDERRRMLAMRRVFVSLESFGVLRHVARWLQWDRGIRAVDLYDHLLRMSEREPHRFPALAWVISYFDTFPTAAVGWGTVYDEFVRLLAEDYGIEPSSALDAAMAAQRHLMPRIGRTFPSSIDLPHDYAAYQRDATASLYTTGRAGTPPRPLHEYPPASLTVSDDPLGLCLDGPPHAGDRNDGVLNSQIYTAMSTAYELDSPLARLMPHVSEGFPRSAVERLVDRYREDIDAYLATEQDRASTAVRLGRRLKVREPELEPVTQAGD